MGAGTSAGVVADSEPHVFGHEQVEDPLVSASETLSDIVLDETGDSLLPSKLSQEVSTTTSASTTSGEDAVESPGHGLEEEEEDASDDADLGLAANPCPRRIEASLTLHEGFWSPDECQNIENWINSTETRANLGLLRGERTLDKTPHRSKYFFGHGYTYGQGMRGREELLPLGMVDEIPDWMFKYLIRPLEERGVVPEGWIDSVVMNDYRPGSSIVAHVDPPRLFARPILTATFFCSARLVFGASFDVARTTPPAYTQLLERGCLLALDGYAANRVTHGIRPEDLLGHRRVSIVLRHVLPQEPREAEICSPQIGLQQCSVELLTVLHMMMQGMWRDQPGEGDRIYLVMDWSVFVFIGPGSKTPGAGPGAITPRHASETQLVKARLPRKASSAAAVDFSASATNSPVAIWPLQLSSGGILCWGDIVEPGCVLPDRLLWRAVSTRRATGWLRVDPVY